MNIRKIIFETEGTTLKVKARCPLCRKKLKTWMTVFMKDYTYGQCQADLISGHKVFECKRYTR